jgi:hypothetical protein
MRGLTTPRARRKTAFLKTVHLGKKSRVEKIIRRIPLEQTGE